ncbi:unnamed protein product [Orchesella dallaii]|uniref:Uncharacterized protein n=1 Tax=Orchesella dallaii TaxID=48710 RepID=A0ABP1QCE9_9HEXA
MKQQIFITTPLLIATIMIFTTICNAETVKLGQTYIKTVQTGKLSKLVQSLKNYPLLKPELYTYYKQTYEKTTPNWKFPVVRNLDQYLLPFTQCFVHITNFQNVNFQSQATVPLLIRHLVPSKITSTHLLKKEVLTWAPTGINANGSLLAGSSGFQCPFSKYGIDFSFHNGICSSIHKSTFYLSTRPWNCEVAIALFPSLYIFENLDPLKHIRKKILPIYLSLPHVWTPTRTPIYSLDAVFETNSFNIWILDELYEKTYSTQHAFKWKSTHITGHHSSSIVYDTFAILKTARVGVIHKLVQEESDIRNVHVPVMCQTFSNQGCRKAPKNYILNEKFWNTGTIREIHESLFQNFQNRWYIQHQMRAIINQQQNFLEHFKNCENEISHKNKWVNLPFTSVRRRYAHAFVHVWLAIMGNYTYHIKGYECSNGILQEAEANTEKNPFKVGLTIYQIVNVLDRYSERFSFSDPFNSLRFVSCGRPKETGLPFEKLVNEFEWEIWVWLIICVAGLAFLPESDVARGLNQGIKFYLENVSNRIQFQGKALLEQGSSFLASPYMSRLTQAIFLLLAIVISNAYKGENVFQLISNRQRIPYKYFSELTGSKFDIFTRIDNVHVYSNTAVNRSHFLQTQHYIAPKQKARFGFDCNSLNQSGVAAFRNIFGCNVLANSEVFELISGLVHQWVETDEKWDEYKKLERLRKNTKLLPRFWELFSNVQDQLKNYSGSKGYYKVFQSWLLKLQERHALEVLKECNKVAIVLPALTCNQIAKNLSRNENLVDVFVGKKVLYDRAFKVSITGSVSVNQVMRAKRVLGSGIWDFWFQIFQYQELFNVDKSSETQLEAPSMSGNISVVFTIILFGFVCSIIVFVIEVRRAVNRSHFLQTQHYVVPKQKVRFGFDCNSLNQSGVASFRNIFGCNVLANSEVFEIISGLVHQWVETDEKWDEYKKLERLRKNTKLLPRFWELFSNVQDRVKNYSGSTGYYKVFQSWLLKLQKRHALEVLRECNKVAVVLPALTCNQIAKYLARNENLADVFVGKKVLYDRAFKVSITGSVSVNQVMRAKRVLGSGIWDFWFQIFQYQELFNVDKSSETQLEAPSMSGNISVVFTIILFGFVWSIIVFVIEVRRGLYCLVITLRDFISNLLMQISSGVQMLLCNWDIGF